MNLPKLALIKQNYQQECIEDIKLAVQQEVARVGLKKLVKPGMRIGIGAGSRGIHAIAEVVKAVVNEVSAVGGIPVIIPAMGSHGGATAEGQVQVLESLGISEESMGAKMLSSMEVEMLGLTANGVPVYFDKNALSCDGLIVVNRIKPHTDFRGTHESGLLKMLAVGLGKHAGCTTMHKYGLGESIPAAAQIILEKAPVLLGIGIVENAQDKPLIIEAILAQDIFTREAELLKIARARMAGIPFDQLDLLIVYEMGKKISGTGIDTNVVGRFKILGVTEPERPVIKKVGVLNLRNDSYGNALGIGLADLTTEKLVKGINYEAMYANLIPTSFLERGKIPVTLPSDRAVVETGLQTVGNVEPHLARVVVVKNTLELSTMYVSEALQSEVDANPNLEWEGEFNDWPFVEEEFIWK